VGAVGVVGIWSTRDDGLSVEVFPFEDIGNCEGESVREMFWITQKASMKMHWWRTLIAIHWWNEIEKLQKI
jgi:hypothetical protein